LHPAGKKERDFMQRAAVVLAAGQGTRMKSELPKVLHSISGKPLIGYVLQSLAAIGVDKTYVVVGYKAEEVVRACEGDNIDFVYQETRLGTGHAVMQCEESLSGFDGTVLVLNGDVPGLRSSTISEFIEFHENEKADATVLTAMLEDPTGYGRIVRAADGSLSRIVEEKDASAEEKRIREINSGLFCFNREPLFASLKEISRSNAQNEYYLTDVIAAMRSRNLPVRAYCIEDPMEVAGVNTIEQLRTVETYIAGREE